MAQGSGTLVVSSSFPQFSTRMGIFSRPPCAAKMHKMAFSEHSYFHYFNLEHYVPLPKLLSSMALGEPKRGHNLDDCP